MFYGNLNLLFNIVFFAQYDFKEKIVVHFDEYKSTVHSIKILIDRYTVVIFMFFFLLRVFTKDTFYKI